MGTVLAVWLPVLPPFGLCLALLLCVIVLHCQKRWHLPAAFLLGMGWLCCTATLRLDDWWPVQKQAQDIWTEGIIWSLPVQSGLTLRFQFRLERYCAKADFASCAPADWQSDRRVFQVSAYEPFELVPGQHWRLQLRVRRPHGQANPGGFDYEGWSLQQKISATGYIRASPDNVKLRDAGWSRFTEHLRYRLAVRLQQVPTALQHLPLIKALAIGEGSGIPDWQWDLFRQTGTTHLMVISGSHISLVAGLVFMLARQVLRCCSGLVLFQPAPVLAACCALFSAWLYTGLAGFNLPAQRALLMSAIVLSGVILRRQTSSWNVLCLALAVMLVYDPLAPVTAGFWLSFIAVAILQLGLLANPDTEQPWWHALLRTGRQLVCTQLRISLVLLPLTALFFRQISVSAPLLNLLAIPLIGLVGVPLSLLSMVLAALSPSLAVPILNLTDSFLGAYLTALQWLADHLTTPALTLPALTDPGWMLLVLLAGAWLIMSCWRHRLLSLLLLPLVLWFRQPAVLPGTLRMVVLDVGQGTAVLLSTSSHHLIYDTGPGIAGRYDAGTDIVLPALQSLGVASPDRIVVSHADADHAGGLQALIRAYPESLYTLPAELQDGATARHDACYRGERWRWEGVQFEFLHPDTRAWNRNDGSCVLLVSVGQYRILLTGDIERRAEQQLLASQRVDTVTIMLAPHHGSQTSSSAAFVGTLRPAHVVYTSGYQNRYGHPAAEVELRYARLGSIPWYTAYDGAITITLSPDQRGLQISRYRDLRRRFWSLAEPVPGS